jgi:cardiolipin synthase A/B
MKTVGRLKAIFLRTPGPLQMPRYLPSNRVQLYVNGDEAIQVILRMIAAAKESIRLQVMLFDPDEIGLEIADALAAVSLRGVRVQLSFNIFQTVNGTIADHLSSAQKLRKNQAMQHMLVVLRGAGVEVRENPAGKLPAVSSASPQAQQLQREMQSHFRIPWNHYDHRKLLIVDDQQVLLGGMNVGRSYLYHLPFDINQDMLSESQSRRGAGLAEGWEKWQDTVFTLEGPAVAPLIAEFNWKWEVIGGKALPAHPADPFDEGVPVQILRQRPGLPETALRFFDLVASARSEIWVASPFVSYTPALDALAHASRRGVRVIFVYPHARQEMPLSRAIFKESAGLLIGAGIELYFNDLRMAHTKLMVVDQQQVLLGSFNLNHRSFRHDLEIAAVVDDRLLSRQVIERVFLPYLSISRRVNWLPKTGFHPYYWIARPFS